MPVIIWIVYRLVKYVLWLPAHLAFDFKVKGEENLPKRGGYILAPNHQGMLDTLLLPICLKAQIAFAAKIELFKYPGLKQLLILTGQIPVRRRGATLSESRRFRKRAEAALNCGLVLGIFPEGTRSRSRELLAFEPGAAMIAVQTGRPVVPVGIAYSRGKIRRVVRISIGEPIDSACYRPKDLTIELRRRIAEQSGQELAAV